MALGRTVLVAEHAAPTHTDNRVGRTLLEDSEPMLKRTVAILASAAVVIPLFAGPASAQEAEIDSYGAGATATALYLTLGDQELTFSTTAAAVGSEPEAAADGQAAVTPLFSTPGAPVESTGDLVTGTDCVLDEQLPAPIDLAGLELACVRTSAEVDGGSPAGAATSDEIVLDIISAELVGEVTDAVLRPLLTELLAGLAPLLAQLEAIVPDLTPSLDQLISLVLNDLSDGGNLASLEVAPTASRATDVEAIAEAQGIVVGLLPGLIPGIGNLATVTVGDSFASAAYDPETDEVVLDGEAAFLDVDLTGLELILNTLIENVGTALTSQFPPPLDEVVEGLLDQALALLTNLDDDVEELVNVTVDQLACPDSPLAALLCFEAGGVRELDGAGLEARGFTFGEGTRGIEAEVLGLSVLDETVALGIGQTSAGANGVLATPAAPPTDGPQQPLPRTGGGPSLPLALGLFGAAVGGLAIVRRTRTA